MTIALSAMDVVAGTILLCVPLPGAQAVGASMLGAGLGGIAGGYVAEAMGGSFETGAAIGSIVGAIVGGSIYRLVQHLRPIDVAKMAQEKKNNGEMQGAVSGTEKTVTLKPGHQLDRYGNLTGRYMTDLGTPVDQLALPPTNDLVKTSLQVVKPLKIQSGIIAPQPWGLGGAILPGGGIQYFSPKGIQYLINKGFLIII